MIPVMCIVQEGDFSPTAQAEFKSDINRFAIDAFCDSAQIDWIEISKGNGFSGGALSSVVVTSLQSNRELESEERAELLDQLGRVCLSRTVAQDAEVIACIRDPESERIEP